MKTLCLDFDGVVHSYDSGWQGAAVISDGPVPGALAFINEATKYFTVAIYSSRSGQEGGITAMKAWLHAHATNYGENETPKWLSLIQWPTSKPAAVVTLDDRALTFDGRFPTLERLLNFVPWNKISSATKNERELKREEVMINLLKANLTEEHFESVEIAAEEWREIACNLIEGLEANGYAIVQK